LGEKWIQTFNTPTVNSPEKEIQPFSKFSPYYNWFTGVTYFPDDQLNIKANIATGVRVPNLAELSSNGLHEGIFTYEIGNPLLKNEQNIAFNLFTQYNHSFFEIAISPFYNLFYNYVYLTPTNEKWFGFPIYRYQQQNAIQYGTEGSLTVKLSHDFQFKITYSGMNSQTADGNYTPYLPAQKIVPHVSYNFNLKNEQKIQLFSELEYCEAQTHVAPFELATPAYRLWNVGASTAFTHAGKTYRLSLTGNNLGNEAYYDHLSRFKNFGLLNIGRNIALNFKMNFQKPLKIN
jgi:iron complex outermembrane recepter protein